MPPYFVVSDVDTAHDLRRLRSIEVLEDEVTQGAGQWLNLTVVDVELVYAHPVRNVVDRDRRILRDDRYVVSKQRETVDVRRTDVLHRVQRRVRPDQVFLTSRFARNQIRTTLKMIRSRLIERRGDVIVWVVLIGPPHQHGVIDRIEVGRVVWIRADKDDEPIRVRKHHANFIGHRIL